MAQRLSWNRIRELFNGQWVELTDCEWEWSSPFPRWAKVGQCAESREELIRQVHNPDSLVLFIGATEALVKHYASQISL